MKSRSLFVLGAVFFCAFLGRTLIIAESFAEGAEGASGHSDAKKGGAKSVSEPMCITGPLADSLEKQLASLEQRKSALKNEEQLARVFTAQVEKRLTELQQANDKLSSAIARIESAKDGDLKRVAAIYGQMKPQMAGAIINKMAPEFAAGLLLEMDGESASGIIANMDADRAYAITVLMTNRASQVLADAHGEK